MTHPQPLSDELLQQFVAGELDDAQTEAILTRLAEDEASLEKVDALWQEQSLVTAAFTIPPLEPERAQRLRHRLVRQIHRANLSVNIIKMGTCGFGRVAVSLLRPLLAPQNHKHRQRRRNRNHD
ncbi:MAG: hypothetical protein IPM53_19600 [Anaerolineaceae bacterium]|nr:hypothetical protein [Anaerolineaceae bacterium]